MAVERQDTPIRVTTSESGRLTVVLERGFEPREVLAALTEAAGRRETEKPVPTWRTESHYAGEFLG